MLYKSLSDRDYVGVARYLKLCSKIPQLKNDLVVISSIMLLMRSFPKSELVLFDIIHSFAQKEYYLYRKNLFAMMSIQLSLYSQSPRAVLMNFHSFPIQMGLTKSTTAMTVQSLLNIFADQCMSIFNR